MGGGCAAKVGAGGWHWVGCRPSHPGPAVAFLQTPHHAELLVWRPEREACILGAGGGAGGPAPGRGPAGECPHASCCRAFREARACPGLEEPLLQEQ